MNLVAYGAVFALVMVVSSSCSSVFYYYLKLATPRQPVETINVWKEQLIPFLHLNITYAIYIQISRLLRNTADPYYYVDFVHDRFFFTLIVQRYNRH